MCPQTWCHSCNMLCATARPSKPCFTNWGLNCCGNTAGSGTPRPKLNLTKTPRLSYCPGCQEKQLVQEIVRLKARLRERGSLTGILLLFRLLFCAAPRRICRRTSQLCLSTVRLYSWLIANEKVRHITGTSLQGLSVFAVVERALSLLKRLCMLSYRPLPGPLDPPGPQES